MLERIYADNFASLVAPKPRPLNTGKAIEECERLATIAEAFSGTPAAETEAAWVAELLAGAAYLDSVT